MRIALIALLLVGCPTAAPIVTDGGWYDAAPTPVVPACRPQSEDPTCTGACDGFFARCPDGYAPRCSDGSAHWERNSDGDCRVLGDAWNVDCDTGAAACSEPGTSLFCVPPSPSLGCPD